MAEKRVSVRLVAEGGRQVRAELEGVGEAGARGFGRLSSEMDLANTRVTAFARRATLAAAAATAALVAAGGAMIRSGLQTVDAQAKLAQSLGTTVASIQTLERAGELAGVSMSGIEQATKDLTRRLSQAAAGSGPAADALDRLGLSAADLIALPLDQRVGAINAAIEAFVPAGERAAVTSPAQITTAERIYKFAMATHANALSTASINISMQVRATWRRLHGLEAHFLQDALPQKGTSNDPPPSIP